jgi:hypothetical protein
MHANPQTMHLHMDTAQDVICKCRNFCSNRRLSYARRVAKEPHCVGRRYRLWQTVEQNFALLQQQPVLAATGYPLLAGWSRKGSLGKVTGAKWANACLPASQRRCWPWSTARLWCVCMMYAKPAMRWLYWQPCGARGLACLTNDKRELRFQLETWHKRYT